MDALKNSKKLHLEAEKLLKQGGIDEILRKHSDVLYTGSYVLDLMAWPDIDIATSLFNDPYDKQAFFDVGKEIGQLQNIISMKFTDWHRYPVRPLPQGLYWGIRIENTFHDVPWKIDLWSVAPTVLQEHRDFLKAMREDLTEQSRKLIIEIKTSLINKDGRTPTLSGYHIYQAVLKHRLSSRDDIIEYLKKNDVVV